MAADASVRVPLPDSSQATARAPDASMASCRWFASVLGREPATRREGLAVARRRVKTPSPGRPSRFHGRPHNVHGTGGVHHHRRPVVVGTTFEHPLVFADPDRRRERLVPAVARRAERDVAHVAGVTRRQARNRLLLARPRRPFCSSSTRRQSRPCGAAEPSSAAT